MDSELKKLEMELERLAPEALPEGMISRMEDAMNGWQENEQEEKVVPFPVADSKESRGSIWKAVAAMVMLGAATAMLIPTGSEVSAVNLAVATPGPVAAPVSLPVAPVSFEPLSAERDVVSANNHGVVFVGKDVPHRCMRVESLEHYEFEGENGQTLRVSKPSVDYILIPVRAD